MTAPNVLRDESDTREYRSAVAKIISDIESATGDTLTDIAENIGVTRETVSNAKNGKVTLTAIYLERLGRKYGAAFLNPWLARMDAQAAPIQRKRLRDILPMLTGLSFQFAKDRDPDGPGGSTEVPQERRARLPLMKQVQHELGCQIAATEREFA